MEEKEMDDYESVNHISKSGLRQAPLLSIRMMPMQGRNTALCTHSPSRLYPRCYNAS